MPPLLLLHLLTLFLFPAASQGDPADDTYDRNMCLQSKYTCGKVDIQYPFYLPNSTQELSGYSNSSYCGYPDMAIVCEGDTATLQLSSNNSYTVQDINYDNYTVSLAYTGVFEGGDCPRVLRNVTIPSRPASWPLLAPSPSMTTYYFFFHCALTPDFPKPPTIYEMACGNVDRGSEISFVLPEHYVPSKNLSQVCKEVWEVPVPRDSIPFPLPLQWGDDGYGGVPKRGFQLVWDSSVAAQCTQCEHSDGGRCGYNGEGQFIGCFCPGGRREAQHCGQKSSKKRIIIYVITAASGVFLMCVILLTYTMFLRKLQYLLRWKNGSNNTPSIDSFFEKHGTLHPKRYSCMEVKRITKSFAHKLGQGGCGSVYKGTLPDGREVAVKMLKDTKIDGEEFLNEVASISRTSHVNIVTLVGFCLRGSKRALIYDYMPNGSLERYTFASNSQGEKSLNWEDLFNIAIGIARGLEYLHRGCNTRIVHFDIKPHNILLDKGFCPKISDFGLAKLCLEKESVISLGGARGTVGYIAPEVLYRQFGAISSKSDVYSFGMMILEMVGARKNINGGAETSSEYFPQWVYDHLDEYCVDKCEVNSETTELVRKMIIVGRGVYKQYLPIGLL